MQTPALEDFAVLTKKGAGGETVKDEIYYFKDKSKRDVGLRFDLTVPLARIVAGNPAMEKPFKRYQIEKVWRYDRPQAGRYREFTQADADIIGVKSVKAEFECIAIAAEILRELKIDGKVKVNNRKLLEEIALASGVTKEQAKECFRCIDKLEKTGKKEVEKELKQKGIKTQILGQLSNSFKEIEKNFSNSNGFLELKELFELLEENSLMAFVEFDLGLARGLEYYTGTVFEVASSGPSIGGGGRYDDLVKNFGGIDSPAVGISFGVERILEIIKEKTLVESATMVFVAPISKEFFRPALKFVQKLRALGTPTEIDLLSRNISRNLFYASKKGIPYAIVLGEDEFE
ncbi:MAG: histidine--tRNA ligase, partial [Candidatus Diapherotrites archaeon]|nr:histidine--tRNA ligase [Candidatus Diapherotrites archaeon]